MISTYTIIAYIIWTAMFVVWMSGRSKSKQTLKRLSSKRFLLLYISYALLFVPPLFSLRFPFDGQAFGLSGVIVCLMGAGFAVWARMVLGENWSAAAVQKADHGLVTDGPYSLVRHPIYTGFIFAMLGFALTVGTALSYLAVLLGLVSVLVRIPVEERLMNEVFPQYKEYSKRVKKLIPFIW